MRHTSRYMQGIVGGGIARIAPMTYLIPSGVRAERR